MLNFLVETKQEYTIQLINVLTPLIYEGLHSIYQEVIKISNCDNVLKNFQIFMQRIPKWNNDIINNETQRIMNNSKSYSWLEDLIKATLKANIIVLTYNPTVKDQHKLDSSFYQNININDFIHKIYIECARELWSNPYLFYHQYSPIELKRNRRESILLIKDCIKEAIRKLLPVKHILQIYLGEEMEDTLPENNFEKSISEVESRNLDKLIKKDLYQVDQMKGGFKELELKISDKNNDSNTVGSKILNIINNNDIKLTDENVELDNLENKIISSSYDSKNSNSKNSNTVNESETSNYNNKNDKFEEIFSNNKNNQIKVIASENNTNKNKEKFFANYLNL